MEKKTLQTLKTMTFSVYKQKRQIFNKGHGKKTFANFENQDFFCI